MKTHRLVLFAVVALSASAALAQTPAPAPPPKPPTPPAVTAAPPPPPPAPPAPGAPRRDGQPINIRVDTTISESGGNAPPVKKTVTAVAGDGFDASVRETTSTQAPGVPSVGPTSLNVDASPTILSNGKIRVRVTLQYVAGQSQTAEQHIRTDIRQTLVLNLENGKALVISDASDPLSDRRVTVEVTATILR